MPFFTSSPNNTRSMGWFRLWGYGIAWKDTRKHRLYFSERNNYKPYTGQVSNWFIEILLKPNPRRLP